MKNKFKKLELPFLLLAEDIGFTNPDEISNTLSSVMMNIINEVDMEDGFAILRHSEGVDVLPSNIDLLPWKFPWLM